MTNAKSDEATKGKRLVGPWTKRGEQRWVRRILNDEDDYAAVVETTWWAVYRADNPASEYTGADDAESDEARKAAADEHLEAAGWTTEEPTPRAAIIRPKVGAWIQRGGGAFVVDDRGQEAGGVWQSGPTWSWAARRAFLPQLSAHQLETKEAAQAACLEVLRTWADVEGEPPQHVAVERFDDPEVEERQARKVCKALGGEIRKARDILSGVDCEGDRLEDQATNAAGEIRRLRAALERWTKGATPKAIEPAGPLSMLAARDRSGGWCVIDRVGPWKAIEADECEAPPSFGLWLWSGRAEAERDEQVGGWDFIGEWTALPLPVLPDGNASPVEVQRSARTLEAEVSRLEARLKALGDNPDNQRQIVCPSCGEKAWSVCVHLADRMAPPA